MGATHPFMFEVLSSSYYVLWGLYALLLAVLTDHISKYRHDRDFPAFAVFISVSFVKSFVLMTLSIIGTAEVYFYVYWIAQVVVIGALFCVVHEIFDSITERATLMSRRTKLVLIRLATLSAAVLIIFSLTLGPDSRYPLMEAIVDLQRGLGMVIVLFMAVIVMLARAYSVSWQRRDSGIALGVFLAYSFQTLWPQVAAFIVGYPQQSLYRTLALGFDLLAVVVWMYSFVQASYKGDSFKLPIVLRQFRLVLGGKNRKQFSRAA